MGALRFCLAMAVVYGHLTYMRGYPLIPGDTPVQGFYAVSGFYMALVLNEKYAPGRAGYWLFISNRYLRLYPVYLAVLCLTLLVALAVSRSSLNLPLLSDWRPPQIDIAGTAFLLLTQFLMLGQDLYSFLTLHDGSLAFAAAHPGQRSLDTVMAIPQAWTLGVELSFYAVAPFIVRRSVPAMALVLLASLVLRLVLQFAFGLAGDPWSYRFFPSELAVFVLGAIGYRVHKWSGAHLDRAAFGRYALLAVCVAAVLLVNRWHGLTRLASVSALLLIFLAVPVLFRVTRNSNLDRYLGELSYPIYIGHLWVIWLLGMGMPLGSGVLYFAAVTVLTVLLAAVLYALVDRPVDRWRQKRFEAESGSSADSELPHPRLASPPRPVTWA
jgi:peptidoglycan/LPS O-acetylase OafA/YrhL